MSVLSIAVDIAEAAAAAADLDSVSSAARGVGDAVSAAGAQVEEGAGRLDRASESADGLASTSSTLTGAFGALGSGLSLVGLDEYADKLGMAAQATDFLSGVGDLASLAMQSQAVKTAASTAANVAHSVASGVATAATGAMTAAQAALNVVMSANPIGLVVLAVVALVAALVLAYRNSATFREAIDNAGDVAVAAMGAVVDAVSEVVDWFRDLPAQARDAWDKVSGAVGAAVDDAQEFFGNLIDDVKTKPGDIVEGVKSSFTSMFQPILDAIGWVQDLLDKLDNVKLPDFNPLSRASVGGGGLGGGGGFSAAPTGSDGEAVTVLRDILSVLRTATAPGVADPLGAADSLSALLARAGRIT